MKRKRTVSTAEPSLESLLAEWMPEFERQSVGFPWACVRISYKDSIWRVHFTNDKTEGGMQGEGKTLREAFYRGRELYDQAMACPPKGNAEHLARQMNRKPISKSKLYDGYDAAGNCLCDVCQVNRQANEQMRARNARQL